MVFTSVVENRSLHCVCHHPRRVTTNGATEGVGDTEVVILRWVVHRGLAGVTVDEFDGEAIFMACGDGDHGGAYQENNNKRDIRCHWYMNW